MASVSCLGDHRAKICSCGSVTFYLLLSGNLECAACSKKQPNCQWYKYMDPNYSIAKDTSVEFKAADVEAGKVIIRKAIEKNCQCFWADILSENRDQLEPELLLKASNEMQAAGEIRLREDAFEHAMEYLFK